jgi:hypothetical protein
MPQEMGNRTPSDRALLVYIDHKAKLPAFISSQTSKNQTGHQRLATPRPLYGGQFDAKAFPLPLLRAGRRGTRMTAIR